MYKSLALHVQLFISVLFFIGLTACSSHSKLVENGKDPEPNDYWTLKRSHPIYGFDQSAYFQGIEDVKDWKKSIVPEDGPNLNLDWQFEGPTNIGGRVNVITPLSRTSDTIFAGSVNGGIYRTFDGGNTWTTLFQDFTYLAIGSITIDPSNSNTIYAGTGDRNYGGYSYNGNGLYKSTDLGNTWAQIGLGNVGIITSCIVNSSNPNTIVVGALGSGFEKSNNRGVYRTTNGGSTWTNTLFISDSSGVCEMKVHPTNPNIMYASSFNRLNLPDHGITTGFDSKIFKSIDGGITWNQLTNGLPNGIMSRVGIAIAESNPNKLYALYVADNYNVFDIYKSDNAGATWTALNVSSTNLDANALGGFGWYFGRIHVNPFNENHIIVPGVDQYESIDGGSNWNMNVPPWYTYQVHADKHDLYFKDASTIVISTDGGVYKTINSGTTWNPLGEMPISQFYRVNANTYDPTKYAGGLQDNGTTSGNNINTGSWTRDFGGDGFQSYYINSESIVTYETQRGGIRWDDPFNGTVDISTSSFSSTERTNWDTPYMLYQDKKLTVGSFRILTMDNPPNSSYNAISGDLTRIGLGATTPERYSTISELNYNPFNQDEILVGTSDGLVWKGTRSLGNFVNITATLPYKFVSAVNYSKKTNGKIYVAMTGYYNNFSQALIYKSEDGGATYTDISSNLPAIGINTLITHYVGGVEALIIGTDAGVFFSNNDGATWDLLGNNLPLVTVADLDINTANQRLIAGTFGRSMWSYDFTWALSLEEISTSDQIVYPNPAGNNIQLKNSEETLEIFSLEGTRLMILENYQAQKNIDISKLEKGVYLLRTKGDIIRFVKE